MNRSRVKTTRPLAALREGRTDWFSIKAQATGPTNVMIYDEIGYWGVSAQDFVNQLAAIEGDLDVHLNSPGGEIFDGIAIYEALSQRDGDVSITVDSLAASIASVIAMAASPGQLTMGRNATMMIHNGWGMCVGDAADMKAAASVLDMLCGQIAGIYADRTGKPVDEWRAAMAEESWYTAEQAVAAGLADQVAAKKERAQAPAASWDLSVFAHTPPRLLNATGQPYRPQPYEREAWENVKCPACSKYSDDDAMYCGQCGTKLAGREDVQEDEAAEPTARADTTWWAASDIDESDWDGPKAMSMAANSDDPAATYKQICAGRREGDASKQGSWALPYRYPGKGPNAAGVKNALSRLPQTDGLTNKDEAQSKLEALMKQINPDYEPSSSSSLLPDWFAAAPTDPFTQALKGVLA